MARKGHLYRGGAKKKQEKLFVERYGPKKGPYVYGAVVGKVHREMFGGPHHKGEKCAHCGGDHASHDHLHHSFQKMVNG